eukprot:5475864-Ditylum_brightwellii.AAC.1
MSKQLHVQSPDRKTSEITDVNPPPNIISPINVSNKCMVNPYSHGNKYNNNPFETFVPISNLLTIRNPYLPNGTHINNSKHMLKEDGASSNVKQPPTPFYDEEEQARMRLPGMIKSGLATNPIINKKKIRETMMSSPGHITKGYNLHNHMIKTLLDNPNLKYLQGKSKGGKTHQSNTKHVLEKFFDAVGGERSQQK